ncbi:kinase-like domain-containing protein [Cercophora newfieldiana]|uniref:Kinase-like domain-containing protein n=1 Tax=Cercophora newfieldiana TaxID=92897 RepID=A0AA39Y1R9_9PEZI|nr:kinase-like domain-containing protein [Cercophora newfieldiana]
MALHSGFLSSTLEHGHEPFETFQLKAHAFAKRVLWPRSNRKTTVLAIGRLPGGSYNRIITATRYVRGQVDPVRYIIRIPRDDNAFLAGGTLELDKEVAILRFLRKRLPEIPAPRVVKFDMTHGNEFGRKHMVQTYLPGESILNIYTDLPHPARCQLATELGGVYRRMLETRTNVPGVIVLPAGVGQFRIAPYPNANPADAINFKDAVKAEPVPVLQLIEALLNKRRDDLTARIHATGKTLQAITGRYANAIKMAQEMAEAGHFDDVDYCLFHIDMLPRNMLADPNPAPGAPVLTGIIDWDFARFFPSFMAAKPPHWLWVWDQYVDSDNDDDENDDHLADDTPESAQDREVKLAFEQAAGPIYARFSGTVYRLARRILDFAVTGDYADFEPALAEWSKYKEGMSSEQDGDDNDVDEQE